MRAMRRDHGSGPDAGAGGPARPGSSSEGADGDAEGGDSTGHDGGRPGDGWAVTRRLSGPVSGLGAAEQAAPAGSHEGCPKESKRQRRLP